MEEAEYAQWLLKAKQEFAMDNPSPELKLAAASQ